MATGIEASIDNSAMGRFRRLFVGDRFLLYIVIALVLISVLAVYSSTSALVYQRGGGHLFGYITRHVIYLILSLVAMVCVSHIKPRYFSGTAEVMVGISFILLVLTMFTGSSINGSARWLNLFGLVQFQPSEIAKVSLVLYVARKLAQNHDHQNDSFWSIMIATGMIAMPIMLQNLSTCLLILSTVFCMMIIGRISMKYMLSLLLVAVAGIGLIILFASTMEKYFPRATTWKARIERFMDNSESTVSPTDQAEQAITAVSTGGLLGRGIGKSYIKNFLPMAYSDFIFSIILEEWGLLGTLLVPFLYFSILARSRIVAIRSTVPFHIYTIIGLAIMVSTQALINMLVGVGLMPVTGQTLPLVSMGGTSNLLTGCVFGIMLSVSHETELRSEAQK